MDKLNEKISRVIESYIDKNDLERKRNYRYYKHATEIIANPNGIGMVGKISEVEERSIIINNLIAREVYQAKHECFNAFEDELDKLFDELLKKIKGE